MGVRRKAPGAHAETEQMSTGRTRVRGVTKLKEALWATPSDDSDEWASRFAQDDTFSLSFWGKYATAAGGGKRERVCGGEKERKEPAQATR